MAIIIKPPKPGSPPGSPPQVIIDGRKIPQTPSTRRGGGRGGTPTQPGQRIAQPSIPKTLVQTAQRVVGTIRRVERRQGQITFIGVTGRRFTPSSERLRRTGAISEREFQGRAGSGSDAAIRREIAVREASATKQIMRLSESQRQQLNVKQKNISIPLRASPKTIRRNVLKVIKTPIKAKKITELKKLERDIRDIQTLERKAAVRSQRAADIFRAIPGLKGDNFAQQTARALLALPTRATIGLGEQVIISGLKLGITAKAVGLAKKGVINIKPIQEETGRALKQVPITIAKGYDPRTPEGLANVIATVALFKIAKGSKKVSTKAVKTASKSVSRKALGLAKKQSGLRKAFNKQVAKDLSKLTKKPGFIRKSVIKANALRKAIPRAVKGIRAKRISKSNVQREIIRKLDVNKVSIKKLVALRKKSIQQIKKSGATGAVKRAFIKGTKRGINKKLASLKRATKQLAKRTEKISPLKKARLRRDLKKSAKAQAKESTLKVASEERVARAIQKRLKTTKKLGKIGKPKRQTRTSIRKTRRKEIIRKQDIRKQKQSNDNLIRNSDSYTRGVRTLAKKTRPSMKQLSDKFTKGKEIRLKFSKSKKSTRKNPFSPKERLKELRRLNLADKKARMAQNQIQRVGQKTIQILEKPIRKIRNAISKAKRITKKTASNIKSKLAKIKNKLKSQKNFANRISLRKTASKLASQIIVINNLINNVNAKARITGRPISRVIPISKAKPKQTTKREVIQKPKEDEIVKTIPDTRLDNKPKQTQLRIITTVLASLAVASAFRVRGKRVLAKQTRLRGGLRKARKFIFNKLQKKRRAFTPDIYSLIFGIRARPRERITLLRPGRVFTGAERRAIVRR